MSYDYQLLKQNVHVLNCQEYSIHKWLKEYPINTEWTTSLIQIKSAAIQTKNICNQKSQILYKYSILVFVIRVCA